MISLSENVGWISDISTASGLERQWPVIKNLPPSVAHTKGLLRLNLNVYFFSVKGNFLAFKNIFEPSS